MKKLFLLLVLIAVFFTSNAQVKSQAEANTMSLSKLDSLILKKSNTFINLKEKPNVAMTRGVNQQDPCRKALDDLSDLYSNLKVIYKNCCNGESSVIALGIVVYKIWKIWDSTTCIWDDNPRMYAAALYYQLDFDNYKSRFYCPYDCGK